MRLLRQQTGDTIVEVLIAITVVGAILAGAFVASNYSLDNVSAAQQRTIALKLAESQLEQISADANSKTPDVFFTGSFYMNNGLMCGGNPQPCSSGFTVANGINYQVVVNVPPPAGSSNNQYTFNAVVTWLGTNQASLSYKVDKL